MGFFKLLIIALILNIDSLFFGMAFGQQKLKVSILSKTLIFFISFAVSTLCYSAGYFLSLIVDKNTASTIGTVFMLLIGTVILLKTVFQKDTQDKKILMTFSLRYLGITVKIIKEPSFSDINNSGAIEPIEAIFVSLALSIDAMVVSLTLSIMQNTLPLIFLIPLTQISFLSIGNILGHICNNKKNRVLSLIPGIVIIVLAFLK